MELLAQMVELEGIQEGVLLLKELLEEKVVMAVTVEEDKMDQLV